MEAAKEKQGDVQVGARPLATHRQRQSLQHRARNRLLQALENGMNGLYDCLRCFKGNEVTNIRQELHPKQVGKRVAKSICPCRWRNRISLAPENHRRMRDGNRW